MRCACKSIHHVSSFPTRYIIAAWPLCVLPFFVSNTYLLSAAAPSSARFLSYTFRGIESTNTQNQAPQGGDMQPEQLCAHCQKPASQYCRACFEATTELVPPKKTFYCNAECQKAGWAAHTTACTLTRRRCQLYRAAEVLQATFYLQRERVFDVSIAKIEREENTLHIWEGDYTNTQYLTPFPYHLVVGKEEKEAVLSMLTCDDALAWMHDLIGRLLDGIINRANHHMR